jgi:hypothetical protein
MGLIHSERSGRSTVVLWLVTIAMAIQVGLNGWTQPFHNWDEIPYVFLTAHHHCNAAAKDDLYQTLQERVPAIRDDLAAELNADDPDYGSRAYKDTAYFCSNLPFYSSKRFYIGCLRLLNRLLHDPLLTVRLSSILPSLALFLLMAAVIVRQLPGGLPAAIVLLAVCLILTDQLARLSTPDALASLCSSAAVLLLLQGRQRLLRQVSHRSNRTPLLLLASAALMAAAISTRINLTILLLAGGVILVAGPRSSSRPQQVHSPGEGLQVKHRMRIWTALTMSLGIAGAGMITVLYHNLVKEWPDSYSFQTMWLFLLSIGFGPGLPAATIHDISWTEMAAQWPQIWNQMDLIRDQYGEALMDGIAQITGFTLAVTTSALVQLQIRRDRQLLVVLAISSWLRWAILGFVAAYLLQLLVFPNSDLHMVAPYVLAMILAAAHPAATPLQRQTIKGYVSD